MNNAVIFIQRIFSGSLKRMLRNIRLVEKESGRSGLSIFFDMIGSMFVYGTGYLDYMTFGFAMIGKEKRRTFMTMNDNIALNKQLNQRQWQSVFEDKLRFNEIFSSFLGREWLDLKTAPLSEFIRFCKERDSFFVKQNDSFGGLGVQKITLSENTDLERLYASLGRNGYDLAEETIQQHPEMDRLCARSINTLRITTLLDDLGKPHCVYSLLRVGNGKKDVDNVTSGGMYTLVGEDGVLHYPAFCDKTASYYEKHPVSGTCFAGFRIPYFQEAVELCLTASQKVPQMRYIGWDVAISPTGPRLVEGNSFPGYDMPQNHRFHPDGCGLRPLFEKILGRTFKP